MSISQPRLQNPFSKYIEFSGESGTFFYYDKDQKKKIDVPMPLYLAVMDELSTISGYSDKHKCGIYSNEVHSTKQEVMRVRTFKGGEYIEGLYAEIIEGVKAIGGHYCKSVYALMIREGQEPELVNIKFKGSSSSEWMEKRINSDSFLVGVQGTEDRVKGITKYKVPVFKAFTMKPEIKALAIKEDEKLQEYFKAFKRQSDEARNENHGQVLTNAITDPEPLPEITRLDSERERIVSNLSRKNAETVSEANNQPTSAWSSVAMNKMVDEFSEPTVDDLPF